MTLTRAAALGLAALAGCAAVVITLPGQATAATAYRYWAYYVAHGTSWQYSQRGPASEYPVDGEVQGWRFAVQADAANGLLPRAAPDFATICASTPARAGELRVGVVVDFGLATDAPAHERPPAAAVPGCVYVQDGKTGADVLAAAAAIRLGTGSDAGLVCGIDGYPKTECAVAVTAHSSSAPSAPTTSTPSAIPSTATVRPIPSTRPPTATPSLATSSAPSDPSLSSDRAPSSDAAQPSDPVLPSAPTQSFVPATSATASELSLAALRSNTRHSAGFPLATIAGVGLIVILGAGAVWRTRVRRR